MSEADISYFKETLQRLDRTLAQNDKRIALLEKFVVQVEAREEERRKIAGKLKHFLGVIIAVLAVYISYLALHK